MVSLYVVIDLYALLFLVSVGLAFKRWASCSTPGGTSSMTVGKVNHAG